jgi:hypothetical protein
MYEKVERVSKAIDSKKAAKEEQIGRLMAALLKLGVRNFENSSLAAASSDKNRQIADAARDLLELQDSIKRLNVIQDKKEEARLVLMRMLQFPDEYFTKGADGKHLDTARYNELAKKRGNKSAVEKADAIALGLRDDDDDDAVTGDGSTADGRKRARKV